MSGSQSLVSEVTGTVGAFRAASGQTFWVASVWASKAMMAAKSPPISGSGAEAVLVVSEGSSARGWVTQVNGIFEGESVSLVILLCTVLGDIWAQGSGLGQVGFGLESRVEQTWLQKVGCCANLSFMSGIFSQVEGMSQGATARQVER